MPRSKRKNFRCPYCGAQMILENGDTRRYWVCSTPYCDARVGVHPGSGNKPMGRPAREELRRMRVLAHALFDPIWKYGDASRSSAYRWLSKRMGIPWRKCHIGMFDEEQCGLAIKILGEFRKGRGVL